MVTMLMLIYSKVHGESERKIWKEQHKIAAIRYSINKNWNRLQNQCNECQQPTATDVTNYEPHADTWHLNRVSMTFFLPYRVE